MRLLVDSSLCRGCRICELACSYFAFGAFNPRRSRVRVTELEEFGLDFPIVCRQCVKCVCIAECPVEGALKRDPQTRAVIVDRDKCIGCGVCVEACPFGAVSLDLEDGLANICNLCGGDPKCVKWCPSSVFSYVKDLSTMEQKRRIKCATTISKCSPGKNTPEA